jgi:hypothetical protein
MSSRTKNPSQSTNVIFVPLNKLKKSPKNVRKIPHTKADITALAASIGALGMLQYPVIEPEADPKGKPTGNYLVNAGEGRPLAQLLRAKRKEIKADEPIPCTLDTEHSATKISLAENAVRTEMHPADQYEAFAKLHREEGRTAEDIAARFGVTPAVVRQRLKLGAVSPKLRTLYRKGRFSPGTGAAAPASHDDLARKADEQIQHVPIRAALRRAWLESTRRVASDPIDGDAAAANEIERQYQGMLAGIRQLPRSQRPAARRAAREWRHMMLAALRERRKRERLARLLLKKPRTPAPR